MYVLRNWLRANPHINADFALPSEGWLMKEESDLHAHLNLRLEQSDLEQLRQLAERSCRSLQGEIRFRLKQSLAESAKTEAA
jgi:hypothetical protein